MPNSRSNRNPEQDQFRLRRFPNSFAPEAAGDLGELLNSRGWALLLRDLAEMSNHEAVDIIHKVPTTDEAIAQQNFQRGKIAGYKDLLQLVEEWQEWKEAGK